MRVKIFNRLKKLLKKYEGDLKLKVDSVSEYDLWSFKEMVIAGRKRKEVNFAGLVVRKRYVSFHFMPIYVDAKRFDFLSGLLKGKACFHVVELDAKLEKQIVKALKIGYKMYKEKGWV